MTRSSQVVGDLASEAVKGQKKDLQVNMELQCYG